MRNRDQWVGSDGLPRLDAERFAESNTPAVAGRATLSTGVVRLLPSPIVAAFSDPRERMPEVRTPAVLNSTSGVRTLARRQSN